MKKYIAMTLALLTLVFCTACGGSGDKKSEDKDLLAQIKEQGYIEVATEPYFAPYEFIDPTKSGDEQYVGFDIEIAKYIADKIGVELKLVPLDFTAVLAGIVDGKYDMAISAIAYSPDRANAMELSKVYRANDTGFGFIVRTADKDKYNSVEDLKDAVVITQSGSVQESLYNQNVKACKEFKLVANMTDAYLAVAEGKADVCICSTKSAQLYADANGGLTVPEFRFTVDPEMNGNVIAFPKDKNADSLIELVNEAIDELNKEGKITEWEDQYTQYAAKLGIK